MESALVINNEVSANLGLASTEEMIRELICRFKMTQYANQASGTRSDVVRAVDYALILAEMLGSMNPLEKEYRPIDH